MKEQRIICFISAYCCLILANTSTGTIRPWIFIALAVFWTFRYIKIKNK